MNFRIEVGRLCEGLGNMINIAYTTLEGLEQISILSFQEKFLPFFFVTIC